MVETVEVKKTGYSKFNDVNIIGYYCEHDKMNKVAALPDYVFAKVGDKVRVLHDDYTSYKGFNCVVTENVS